MIQKKTKVSFQYLGKRSTNKTVEEEYVTQALPISLQFDETGKEYILYHRLMGIKLDYVTVRFP